MALTMAGCGFSGGDVVEVTPTPMATPTPTVISITATPLPTSTPAPKMIGKKTAQAKFIYLTNNLQNDIRELYLRVSGDDEGDWGNNLLSAETAFKAAEQVQMYYNGSSSDMSGQTDTENSTETSESSLKYDMSWLLQMEAVMRFIPWTLEIWRKPHFFWIRMVLLYICVT